MENGSSHPRQRPPRYEDEDTSPTTKRELRGWYAYALAAEVYAVCGVGSFLPVTLEQLARERGVLWSDRTTPCTTKPSTMPNISRLLLRAADGPKHDDNQCLVTVFGSEVTTASFVMYTISIAVFVQALALISFSPVADYGHYRKRSLLGFAFVGATTSMLFIFIVPRIFMLGSLLVIIGNTCLGSSFVLLNSFLPLLVSNHPDAQKHRGPGSDASAMSLEPLYSNGMARSSGDYIPAAPAHTESHKSDSTDLKLSTTISSKGIATGYAAAVFVQILSILILWASSHRIKSSTLPLRLVLLLTGLWWFLFSIPSLLFLRPRPGPPLPSSHSRSTLHTLAFYLRFAWSSLYRTLKLALKLRQILFFLLAWFLLSDAIATVSGTAIMFARTELHMGTVSTALVSVIATLSGLIGAFSWPRIAVHFALPSKQVILLCILFMEIVPLYGLLGFLPFVQEMGWGGLQQWWEIYPLAFIHGFVMGGLNSYCRSFFGLLIPPGREAAFYALYAVTDKGSSAVGPAVAGSIVDNTGGIRPVFWFLAILVLLPLPLIWAVDVERGKSDAVRLAGVLGKDDVQLERVGTSEDGAAQEAEGLMRDHD